MRSVGSHETRLRTSQELEQSGLGSPCRQLPFLSVDVAERSRLGVLCLHHCFYKNKCRIIQTILKAKA